MNVVNVAEDYHAHDEKRRRLVFVDLETRNLVFYELDKGRWRVRLTKNNPPARVSNTYGFVWDGDRDWYVRWGGRVNHDGSIAYGRPGSPRMDLWVIPAEGDTWREIPLGGDAPPLTDMAIILWDGVHHRLMLIGGPHEVNDGSIHYLRLDAAGMAT